MKYGWALVRLEDRLVPTQTVQEQDRGIALRENAEAELAAVVPAFFLPKKLQAPGWAATRESRARRLCRDTAARMGGHRHAHVNSSKPCRFSFPAKAESYKQDYHPH